MTLKAIAACSAEQAGEIVDNAMRDQRIFFMHQLSASEPHQCEVVCDPVSEFQTLRVSSREDLVEEDTSPGWWFHHFEPVWTPFIQRLCSQKKVTLFEFERAASQIPGLTPIEKTIAISAFCRQQERGLVPSRTTTELRREHSLSAL